METFLFTSMECIYITYLQILQERSERRGLGAEAIVVDALAGGQVEGQEAGRAGRDGEPARCLCFFGPSDMMTQRRLSQSGSSNTAMDARREQALQDIERYATQMSCRHATLVGHFTDQDEPLCSRCDVCLGVADDVVHPEDSRNDKPAPQALGDICAFDRWAGESIGVEATD